MRSQRACAAGTFLFMAKKTCAYIDGFNMYYSLRDAGLMDHRWLDLTKLVGLVSQRKERLCKIYYFSARHHAKSIKHVHYVEALKSVGVTPVMGRHIMKEFKGCPNTSKPVCQIPEEKQSDVNLAINLLNDAHKNLYDKAYIFSGDSDFIGAYKLLKREFPSKELVLVLPVQKADRKQNVKRWVDGYTHLGEASKAGIISVHSCFSTGRRTPCARWLVAKYLTGFLWPDPNIPHALVIGNSDYTAISRGSIIFTQHLNIDENSHSTIELVDYCLDGY